MKKILLSLSVVAAVAAVVLGATTAFYNDEETSTGNVLAAGAIDLGVDNESYYNGVLNPGTSWTLDYDLDTEPNPDYPRCLGNNPVPNDCTPLIPFPRLFFNFTDLKPGDWGEDTISLHVKDNDSWLCADVTVTSDDDVSSTEPELDVPDALEVGTDIWDGELASHLRWYWWGDDGDNVFEDDERPLPGSGGTFNSPEEETTYNMTLADSSFNVWGAVGPINACDGENDFDGDVKICSDDTRYIGKAWCFGDSNFLPYPSQVEDPDTTEFVDDNSSPTVRPVQCDGSQENNITQTDSMTMDITFRAEQSRHNSPFSCTGL